MLIIMGITIRFVLGKWELVSLSFISIGLLIFFIWLFFTLSKVKGFWGKYSTKSSINALIATGSVLLILLAINVLSFRYSTRLDLTENQLFTLSPQTQQIIKNLPQNLKIWIFTKENLPFEYLLKQYQRYNSNKFQFEFVDPDRNLGLAKEFKIDKKGAIFLEYNQKRQLLQVLNQEPNISEQKLTSAIERIISDRSDKIYFLAGHGEEDLSSVISLAVNTLKEQNYQIESLNLTQIKSVPKSAKILVIAGAKQALLKGEITAIEEYLKNGGSVLLMIDYNSKFDLDDLGKKWGIELDKRLIIDASERIAGLDPSAVVITNYGNHPITQNFKNNMSFYPGSIPIQFKQIQGIEAQPILITDKKSWAESTPEKQPFDYNEGEDKLGPLILGIALEKPADKSRLV
ncbi:MAG TPA: GldG family protein, partial [Allocoleopsis sp.]